MDAIILAAGFGSRLATASGCKPLTRLHGKSLLEIGVLQLRSAGASRVTVVVGHNADLVEATLPGVAASAGIEILARRVLDPRKPNGMSVIAGAEGLKDAFLLVMADHVFADGLLDKLVRADRPSGTTLLAVDCDVTSPLLDPEDATWVQLRRDATIARIGKGLTAFDAVDCGAFLADGSLPDAIRQAVTKGKAGSLSDGMQELAASGRARGVEIEGAWWIDVDDERALGLARREIRSRLPVVFATSDVSESG